MTRSATPSESIETPRVVWVISDGKPGHLNQSLGLAEALGRATRCAIHIVPALPNWRAWLALLLKDFHGTPASAPDLIIGAGHGTHLTLLAARRACGGRTIVLMKPSLPRRWFDLSIFLDHDNVAANARTLVTEGPLNRMRASRVRSPTRGLLLIGGISPHYEWRNATVQTQIRDILARTHHLHWTLTTSRRTPADFLTGLRAGAQFDIMPHTATSPDWIQAQLAQSDTVWVTPDSTSMVYEALTVGATVGVFDLPAQAKSRAARTTARLAHAQRITRFNDWITYGRLHPNAHPLAEADRCAQWILAWLKQKN